MLIVLGGYLDILNGALRLAQANLQALLATNEQQPLAWDLLALASVVLGDNNLAFEASEIAIKQNQGSPTSLLIRSYVQQAIFDLDGAIGSVRQALALDEQNIQGLIALAKLQFGTDHLADAWNTI